MACRGGPWPSRGPCAAAGFPGRCKHRPLQRFVITRGSRLAQNTKFIRRGGIYCARRRVSEANRRAAAALGPEIPPAGVCAAAGFPGRCQASSPTEVRYNAGFPFGCGPSVGRRGGIYPARRCLRRRGVPGTMQASSPTEVRYNAGFPFGRGPSVGRRGGIYPARRCLRRRGVRRDEGIPPYVRPGGRGRPGWPVLSGGHVGEGHAPPEPPRRRKPGGYGVRPCGGCISPGRPPCPPPGSFRPFQNRYGNAPPGLPGRPGGALLFCFLF